jgi:hypothetical protein
MIYAKLIIFPAYQLHSGNAGIIHFKQNLEDKQWGIMVNSTRHVMGQRKRKKSPPLTTIYVGLKLFM